MKELLLFGFENTEGRTQAAALRTFCQPLGISVRVIPNTDYLQPLGSLLLTPPLSFASSQQLPPELFGEYHGPELSSRLLLLSGLDENDMDQLFPALPGFGITRDDLKAMLTDTNMHWNAVGLHHELSAEHEAVSKNRG